MRLILFAARCDQLFFPDGDAHAGKYDNGDGHASKSYWDAHTNRRIMWSWIAGACEPTLCYVVRQRFGPARATLTLQIIDRMCSVQEVFHAQTHRALSAIQCSLFLARLRTILTWRYWSSIRLQNWCVATITITIMIMIMVMVMTITIIMKSAA